MSEKYSQAVKQKAVAEVILGLATMTKVAERYGMSIGYLSILCSRYRDSFQQTQNAKCRTYPNSKNELADRNVSLLKRVKILEDKVRVLFQIIHN